MKRSIKKILNYEIITAEGIKGIINDVVFDEESWTIRYMKSKFENISEEILLPIFLIKNSQIINDQVYVEISANQILNCPKPEGNNPVTRKLETEINRYFNVNNYWTIQSIRDEPKLISEKIENNSFFLHNYKDIKGFDIVSMDGEFGIIDDLVFDDAEWKIMYCSVDTSSWLPWSKKIMLDIRIIECINYEKKNAHVHLHEETLKNAPEYDLDFLIDQQYESKLEDFYSKA